MDKINMDVEALPEIIKEFYKNFDQFQANVEEFSRAKGELEEWETPTKVALEGQMKQALPKFNELLAVLDSYGAVAHQSREMLVETENANMRDAHYIV